MNFLNNSFFVFFLLIGVAHSANAQSILSPEQQDQAIENATTLLNELNLSENDKPAFRAIIEDFFIGLVALRATGYSMQTNIACAMVH